MKSSLSRYLEEALAEKAARVHGGIGSEGRKLPVKKASGQSVLNEVTP